MTPGERLDRLERHCARLMAGKRVRVFPSRKGEVFAAGFSGVIVGGPWHAPLVLPDGMSEMRVSVGIDDLEIE